jgi:hypothetical protein
MSKKNRTKNKNPNPNPVSTRTGSAYDAQVHAAYRLIARHVYGGNGLGAFAYAGFEYINTTYFAGRLPEPLILWDITAFGKCLGLARSPHNGPPIIKLHPSTVAPSATAPRPRTGLVRAGQQCGQSHPGVEASRHRGIEPNTPNELLRKTELLHSNELCESIELKQENGRDRTLSITGGVRPRHYQLDAKDH